MSIYFLSCSQYVWKVRERELIGKWLGQRCSLDMLGSGAGKGVAGVDRLLGERHSGWGLAQWWLALDFIPVMTVGCEGLRLKRWRVRTWEWPKDGEGLRLKRWRVRVEIRDGGWGVESGRLGRWGLRLGLRDGGWCVMGEVRVENVFSILFIHSLKLRF